MYSNSMNYGSMSESDAMTKWAKEVPINVPALRRKSTLRKAIDAYNLFHSRYGVWAHKGCDKPFLRRISLNYIRHEKTDYDLLLCTIRGREGEEYACDILKKRINAKIMEANPWLDEK